MVTGAPLEPEFGESAVIIGAGTTVKLTGLLAVPPELVITTFPLAAPVGTAAMTDVGLQLTIRGVLTPLKLTEPVLPPKLEPLMAIKEPMGAELGVKSAMAGTTVNNAPLLDVPLPALTTKLPVAALLGTTTVIVLSFHDVTVAARGPRKTVPLACDAPNCKPLIVTVAPDAPPLGFSEVIV